MSEATAVATRTVFANTEIVLWRQAETRFNVEVGQSIARDLIGQFREPLIAAHGLGDARAGS